MENVDKHDWNAEAEFLATTCYTFSVPLWVNITAEALRFAYEEGLNDGKGPADE